MTQPAANCMWRDITTSSATAGRDYSYSAGLLKICTV